VHPALADGQVKSVECKLGGLAPALVRLASARDLDDIHGQDPPTTSDPFRGSPPWS